MQKQRIILIIGVVLALIAVFLVRLYLHQQRQLIVEEAKDELSKERENLVPVLMAKQDIPADSPINSDTLEVKLTPKQYVQPQAATSMERIGGMIATVKISKGEQITLNKLQWPNKEETENETGPAPRVTSRRLSDATPMGKRAITISVDNIASLLGMIKPGDYVDVIVTAAVPLTTPEGKVEYRQTVMPLFQNVLVLAVGQDVGAPIGGGQKQGSRYARKEDSAEKKENSSASLITLALSPQEANIVAFVQEQGKIRLVLRSPTDSEQQPFQAIDWNTIFQYVMPKETMQAQSSLPKEPPKEEEFVDIYRGSNKERVPLSP